MALLRLRVLFSLVFFLPFRRARVQKSSLSLMPLLFRETAFQVLQLREQDGDVLLDDVPQDVVVDAEIGMDQPVTGGNDLAPGDLGSGFADFSGDA